MSEVKVTMRTPFPEHQINKLPKGTKAQNDCPPSEKKPCNICGGFHHPKIIHLDYVGHAALTDRLLDVDPGWNWDPLALKDGLPAFDETGGLWIRLTVNGISRLGYGHAAHKAYMDVGSREKEVIGDALRNAAMRFGAALDLWFKGDLHEDDDSGQPKGLPEKKEITPQHKAAWANAKAAYVRDGNLKSVLARVDMSRENQELLIEECAAPNTQEPDEPGANG